MSFPRLSLGTQLVVLLLVALIVAQAASFIVFTDDRQAAVRAASRAGLLESMASITRVLQATPPAGRAALADAAATPRIRYWVSDDSATPPGPRATSSTSRASATAGYSAAGSAWAIEPPTVPRLRICGCPTRAVATCSMGLRASTSWDRSAARLLVMAPIASPPFAPSRM